MKQVSFIMETAQLVRDEKLRLRRKKQRADRAADFFSRVRGVFAFLLLVTVLVFAFCHRTDVQNFIFTNFSHWSQVELKKSHLRQQAINHENEINRIVER
jgi:cell division protein FtsL